jgi:hypothetical protein
LPSEQTKPSANAAAGSRTKGPRDGPSLAGAAAANGPVLLFDQLPWHSMAARLRRENRGLQEEQQAVRLELEQHQVRSKQGRGGFASPHQTVCIVLRVIPQNIPPSFDRFGCNLRQAEILRVEQQLVLFQKAMDAAEEGAAALRTANVALAASEARAASELAGSAAEARRMGLKVSRLQDEMVELRETIAGLMVGCLM